MRADLENIIGHFSADLDPGLPLTFSRNNQGLINQTTIISQDGTPCFVLQKINTFVHSDIRALKNNYRFLAGLAYPEIPAIIPTIGGSIYYTAPEGTIWCLYRYFSPLAINLVNPSVASVRSGALLCGRLQYRFNQLDADLVSPTVPNYQDLNYYLKQFTAARNSDLVAAAGLESIAARFDKMTEQSVPELSGQRIIHGDLKLSNVLFDSHSSEAVAVIDYDTLMPGHLWVDFGDFARSVAVNLPEDASNYQELVIDRDRLAAACYYIRTIRDQLSVDELDSVSSGPEKLCAMLALRFFTDYLLGSKYFQADYPEHNLVRAQNQLWLSDLFALESEFVKEQISAPADRFLIDNQSLTALPARSAEQSLYP